MDRRTGVTTDIGACFSHPNSFTAMSGPEGAPKQDYASKRRLQFENNNNEEPAVKLIKSNAGLQESDRKFELKRIESDSERTTEEESKSTSGSELQSSSEPDLESSSEPEAAITSESYEELEESELSDASSSNQSGARPRKPKLTNTRSKSDGFVPPKRAYQCQICGFIFSYSHHLPRHVKEVHQKIKDQTCLVCNKQFSRKETLKEHLIVVHAAIVRNFECEFCKRSFKSKSSIRLHAKICPPENRQPFTCKLCPEELSSPYWLKKHLLKIHNFGGVHQCSICDRKFKCEDHLKDHSFFHESQLLNFSQSDLDSVQSDLNSVHSDLDSAQSD